jgi:hypothetical protein
MEICYFAFVQDEGERKLDNGNVGWGKGLRGGVKVFVK